MNILSIDPGKSNIGIWCGKITEVDGKIVPETILMEKMDMGSKVSLYKGAVDTISAVLQTISAFCNTDSLLAVVETQDPVNQPARTVAYTTYGYLQGKGIASDFSSSKLKNDAIDVIAQQYGVQLITKPTKEDQPDAKIRRRLMHTTNKKNSKAVVLKLLDSLEEKNLLDKIASAKDPRGRKKADDMTDALLLGIGLFLKNKKKHTTKRWSRTSSCAK
jgi:hypothetical protein